MLWFGFEMTAVQLIFTTLAVDLALRGSERGGGIDAAAHVGGAAFGWAYLRHLQGAPLWP